MWPRRSRAAGWLLALLLLSAVHVQSSASALTVYGKLGGEVSLKPTGGDVTITSITWREGQNIAIEWDGQEVDYNRQYKDRSRLNMTTGVMTIMRLETNDSKVYTPEINNKNGDPIRLVVISAVPVPTVSHSCDEETTTCELTCDADTAGANPVTYMWKSEDNVKLGIVKTLNIQKDASANVKEFSCELKNDVSQARSRPIANPFTPPGGLNIPNGVFVFISLVAAVLLLGVVHRLKAGVWFYEKGSMPWEADFWRKDETAPRDAADSNGTPVAAQQTPSDEETALT